jgi:hypothetical protein
MRGGGVEILAGTGVGQAGGVGWVGMAVAEGVADVNGEAAVVGVADGLVDGDGATSAAGRPQPVRNRSMANAVRRETRICRITNTTRPAPRRFRLKRV